MGVPGASRYLNSSILANTQGIAAVQTNIISDLGDISLLDIGRANTVKGIGLSRQARLMNRQFLESSATQFNALFSLGLGPDATIEGAQQQILALRSKLSVNQVARSLVQDDGSILGSFASNEVDIEA